MIIDAHTHIVKWLPESGSALNDMTYDEACNELLKEMLRNDVGHSVVFPSDKEGDAEMCDLTTLLRVTDGLESHFSVVGTLDVRTLAHACAEPAFDNLSNLIEERKIVGIKIYLGYQHYYANDKMLYPVYQLCQDTGIPVIFHTGATESSEKKAKVIFAHPLPTDDVAVDFPRLKILLAHAGNPWFMDTAMVVYKNENVYADISGLVENCESLDVDGEYGAWAIEKLNEMMTFCGTEKIIYGTDWPLTRMASYIQFAESLDISGDDRDRFFYKNAIEFFNLAI